MILTIRSAEGFGELGELQKLLLKEGWVFHLTGYHLLIQSPSELNKVINEIEEFKGEVGESRINLN